MVSIFHIIVILLFAIYTLITTLSYAIYEIKEAKNKQGGIFTIILLLTSLFLILVALF